MLKFNRIIRSCLQVLNCLVVSAILILSVFNVLELHADDAAGKINASPFTLSFIASDFNGFNISCNGANDGSIDMTITGGTAPFTISWSNGDATEDISTLIVGTYTVTVTDDDGTTNTDVVTLIQPGVININGIVTDVSCNGGNNGAVDITVTDGAGGYTFLWSNSDVSEDLINVTANIYTVTVTDINSCTGIASFPVDEPAVLSITASTVDSVNCFGGSDGSISITVSGGTPNYGYLWNDASVLEDRTALNAGTYTVTVTDQNSCTTSQSFTVNQPPVLTVNVSSNDGTCGLNNGDATANVTGGSGNVSYLWSTSEITQTISALGVNFYTVTVTDGNNCTASNNTLVSNTGSPFIFSSSVDSVGCFGGSDGSINITVAGGTPNYSYLWNDASVLEDRTGLTIGTYTVTVTDQNSCTGSQSFTVNQPPLLTVNISSNNATCGLNNGDATANVTGGSGNATFLWSTTAITQTINSLGANTYTVTVTDQNGCTATDNILITNLGSPSIISSFVDSVNCFGGSDGIINITVTGGTPNYNYLWNDASVLEDRTGLIAGTYTVTVTDQNSCSSIQSFNVGQPNALNLSFSIVNSSCNLNNGSATASVTGGTLNYGYLWSNGQTASTAVNLGPGNYTVTVTDANGCTIVGDTNTINLPGPQIILDSLRNVSCFSGSNGGIYISVNTGNAPFTYQWSNGIFTQDNTNLILGTFTITVTDSLNCTSATSFNISQPLAAVGGTFSNSPASCNLSNGTSTFTATGGTPGYTYLWSNGQTGITATNLGGGPVTITVTDANTCSIIQSTNITVAGQPSISLVSKTDVQCNGGADGSIDIDVTGGVTPYSYLWSPGNFITQDISGLSAGIYTVTVTDSTGCAATDTFGITQPQLLSASFNIYNARCGISNGAAAVNVSGGTQAYQYLWNTGSAIDSIFGVPSGIYTVTITDANSCISVFQVSIGINIPPSIQTDSILDVTCSGSSNGAIYITINNGKAPIQLLWSNASPLEDQTGLTTGSYTVTVTDADNCTAISSFFVDSPSSISFNLVSTPAQCNQTDGTASIQNLAGGTPGYNIQWGNGDAGVTADSLSMGMISVTVTDINGCSRIDSVMVTASGVPQLVLQNLNDVTCFSGNDGSITVTPSGNNPPFNLQWSNGDNGNTADSLIAGLYTVTVTDNIGCSVSDTFSVAQPDAFSFTFSVIPAACGVDNGQATVSITGGNGGNSYLWSNGDVGTTADSLAGNIYTVTVTDQDLCTASNAINVPVNPAPDASVSSVIHVSCFDDSTGVIDVTVLGGTAPLTYNWSNGQVSQDLINIPASTYSLIVTDSAGCTDSLTIAVNEPTEIDIQYTVGNAACGDSTGSISTSIAGGNPPYIYSWSNGQTGSSLTNIFGGTYTLTVTDSTGCQQSAVIGVGNTDGPLVSLVTHQMVSCFQGSDGFVIVDIVNGVQPYQYLWSNGETTQNIIDIAAAIYQLTVTDDNGCIGVFTDTITEPQPLTVSAILNDATCFQPNGSIIILPSGGTPLYTYLWSNGVMSSTNAQIYADTIYTVTITDANTCAFDTSFILSNTGKPAITLISEIDVSCFGFSDGSIDIDVTGGLPPYSYVWTGQLQVTQDLQNIPAGGYDVLVVDTTGCSSTAHFDITEPAEIIISFPLVNNANCGQANGSIIASAAGGNTPYSFLWSNSATNDSIENLVAGSYTLTVTDNSGCIKTSIANISDLGGPIIASADSVLVSCPGGSNGAISIEAIGGIAPLTYSWTNVISDSTAVSNLPANIYTVTISDAANCITIRSFNITDPADFVINASLSQNNPPYNLTCFHSGDGSIDLSVTGGTLPYLYIWSTGSNNEDQLNLTAGTYTVVIRDSNLCETVDTFSLTEPPQILAFAGSDFTVCGQSYYTLNADSPSYGNGFWDITNGNGIVNIVDSTYFASQVDSLQVGDNIFLWTVSDGLCNASDEVIITLATKITAFAGSDKNDLCAEQYTLDATEPQFGFGYWQVLSGGGMLADSLSGVTPVTGITQGSNLFLWTVVNGGCTGLDSINVIKLDSIECLSQVEIPSAFSPNGDGHNDYFVIKGIEDYNVNQLTIFDRWGVEVFSKSGYQNDWKGDNNNDKPIGDGTYFYLLKIEGLSKVYKGYIDVRR